MSTKPTTVPTWNTGGANRAAPSGGQAVAGFANGDQAPSTWFNYWFFWIFSWVQYLADGAFTNDSGPALLGTSTDPGSSGLEGVNNQGGSMGVYGHSTGAGSQGVFGDAPGAAGVGVFGRSTGQGGTGVHGEVSDTSSISRTQGVYGLAAPPANARESYGGYFECYAGSPTGWTGAAVLADGTQSDTYALILRAKLSTPTRGALKYPLQTAAPTAAVEGDSYYNATTHKLYVYDGTTWQACW